MEKLGFRLSLQMHFLLYCIVSWNLYILRPGSVFCTALICAIFFWSSTQKFVVLLKSLENEVGCDNSEGLTGHSCELLVEELWKSCPWVPCWWLDLGATAEPVQLTWMHLCCRLWASLCVFLNWFWKTLRAVLQSSVLSWWFLIPLHIFFTNKCANIRKKKCSRK